MATIAATDAQRQQLVREHEDRIAFLKKKIANEDGKIATNTKTRDTLQKQVDKLAPMVDTLKRWSDAGQERAQREYRTKAEDLATLRSKCEDMQRNGVDNCRTRRDSFQAELEQLESTGLSFELSDELDRVFAEIDDERQAGVVQDAHRTQQAVKIAQDLAKERASWWPFGSRM